MQISMPNVSVVKSQGAKVQKVHRVMRILNEAQKQQKKENKGQHSASLGR